MRRIRLDRPGDFVDISKEIPGIKTEVRYFTGDNFVGERIDGYEEELILVTKKTAEALKRVQNQLVESGYGLKIFDGYRPKQAVAHFIRWGQEEEDFKTKEQYYPEITRQEIFEKGFICKKSAHTRGSTVDLTVIDIRTGFELDMGGSFDYFSEVSFSDYDHLNIEQSKNRVQLKYLMRSEGFEPLLEEWWHFTLVEETYPTTYFDFPIR